MRTAGSFTLTINVVGNGLVIKNPDRDSFRSGSIAELTAIPDAGRIFDRWEGDLTGLLIKFKIAKLLLSIYMIIETLNQ